MAISLDDIGELALRDAEDHQARGQADNGGLQPPCGAEQGRSEAQLIRQAVASLVDGAARPRPRGGLFSSDDPMLFGANVDEALKGFGER